MYVIYLEISGKIQLNGGGARHHDGHQEDLMEHKIPMFMEILRIKYQDQGSGIRDRDLGSGIRDLGSGIRIRNKDLGLGTDLWI